jgi:hypothetical protein
MCKVSLPQLNIELEVPASSHHSPTTEAPEVTKPVWPLIREVKNNKSVSFKQKPMGSKDYLKRLLYLSHATKQALFEN